MKPHFKVPGLLIQIYFGRTIHHRESSRYILVQASVTCLNEATEVAGHYFSGGPNNKGVWNTDLQSSFYSHLLVVEDVKIKNSSASSKCLKF